MELRGDHSTHGAARPRPRGGGWGTSLGLRGLARRVRQQLQADNIGIVAAGVAFYVFLSIFPALAALVSIYGLLADPSELDALAASLVGVLPEEAIGVLRAQLGRLIAAPSVLGASAVLGLIVAIWSASKGTKALMTALDIAYDEPNRRGFFAENLVALALVAGGIALGAAALGVIVAVPVVLQALSLPRWLEWTADLARWPLMAVAVLFALGLLYRFAPSRPFMGFRWVSLGAVVSTLLWIAGSIAFSVYVASFGSYNETYGAFSAVVVLMVWLWLSAYIVLLGAEIDGEAERARLLRR